MCNPTIEKPRVFISYAWSSREYQEKVVSFATDLQNDGIEVVLDKWSLKEGNDTYAFMEQSVADPTITNILILLNSQYEIKSNERSGGVGVETQIISPEIYNRVKQEKVLPIIFERGINGEIPKPAYLKSLLHFDLSNDAYYEEEYRRLVMRLYGIENMKKPILGNKPTWLETEGIVKDNKENINLIERLISEFNLLMNKYKIFEFVNVDPVVGMPNQYPGLVDSFVFDLGQKLIHANTLQQNPKFLSINSFRDLIDNYNGYLSMRLFPANSMYTIQNQYDLMDVKRKDSEIKNTIYNYKRELDKFYGQINEGCSMFMVELRI